MIIRNNQRCSINPPFLLPDRTSVIQAYRLAPLFSPSGARIERYNRENGARGLDSRRPCRRNPRGRRGCWWRVLHGACTAGNNARRVPPTPLLLSLQGTPCRVAKYRIPSPPYLHPVLEESGAENSNPPFAPPD